MAITYPLTPPSNVAPTTITITALTHVGVARSPFSFQTQVYNFGGAAWRLSVDLPMMNREQAEPWIAFLLKLNGPFGSFRMGDPTGAAPLGVAAGAPLVNGGSQNGNSLITDGWAPSTTNILKAGDWLEIEDRLYKNLNDVDSDAGGNATLDIFPRLRTPPANNAVITVSNAKGIFRLIDSEYAVTIITRDKNHTIAFDAEEVIGTNL